MREWNKLLVRGTIVHLEQTRQATIIRIATDGGNNRGRRAASMFPAFTVRNKELMRDLNVGDRVTAQGHVETAFVMENGKRRFVTRFVVESIARTKRILSSYTDNIDPYEGGMPADINTVIMEGTVANVYSPRPDFCLITIAAKDKEGKTNRCTFSTFQRQSKIASSMQPGDRAIIYGEIRTSQRKDNPRILEQNVVCMDIAQVKEENEK